MGTISLTAAALVALRYMVSRGSNGIEMIDPNAYIRPLQADLSKGEDIRYFSLERVRNARDLGGYVTQDGRTVRWGKVFRTGTLGAATDQDLERLGEHGVKLVCDLRSNREVKELPDKVPDGTAYQRFPIHEDDPMREIFPKILFNRAELVEMMAVGYVRMADERPKAFGEILKQMADPDNLPILFHCTAGKDRAGITAALLLGLLDVPKETIIADYSLSNHAFEGLYADFE
ncbi:MAG: tyrosine-protein phosphatase, partial [Chloroflexota bacterium]